MLYLSTSLYSVDSQKTVVLTFTAMRMLVGWFPMTGY
jgi:hypothetical protein